MRLSILYIKRKSKRYGLGYQDVKEEEEEEEELERRRRRRIERRTTVTSIILLLQRGRRENHGGQSGANLRASTGIGTARRVQIESMVLRLRRARKRRVRDFRERDWIVSLGDATTTTTTTTHRKGRCLDATTDDDFDEQEEIGRWEMGVFHL